MISYLLSLYLVVNTFITILYILTKPIYWTKYIIFSIYCVVINFIMLMQSMYIHIEINNMMYSAALYIIASLQPIIYSYIGLTIYNNNIYTKLLTWSILLYFINMTDINIKLILLRSNKLSIYTCNDTYIYTKLGINGYYEWIFSVCSINGYSIFDVAAIILSFMALSFYKKDMVCICKGILLSLTITLLVFMPSKYEFMYVFMATYVFANIYIAFKSKFHEHEKIE